jgi:hypothetical protein
MPFVGVTHCCPSRVRKYALVGLAEELTAGIPEDEALGNLAQCPRTPPGYLKNTGFSLISLAGHVVSAVVKPAASRFRFFDPNNGIAQWKDPAQFDRFMNSYTGRHQIDGLTMAKWLRFG